VKQKGRFVHIKLGQIHLPATEIEFGFEGHVIASSNYEGVEENTFYIVKNTLY